ncbi:MAG TPA: deoxyguanosinetriphosphate triphosphohydrolase [Candidatus Omnitrophota bacterium]|nr:deoxyguanosinetriphosphate triphosphohydrolase [Candidatus Omnitrophota bacterium]
MRTREELEELEDKVLAPYAMKSKDSSGRQYPERAHETRTCYQRDRDRIVHCEAFRKLEYKTQVFVVLEGDYYRTRLTHTIEVAQLGRTIGRNLRLNEDLIEAIALAHDLGHPPFGHAGEEALNQIMQGAKLKGFNHNKRSFEIVTRFEKRYPDFEGLNLSREVLTGILKHQTPFDVPGDESPFPLEEPTLEAQVVDVADSLAYLNHDIDDGLTSGCITEDDLTESELWQRVFKKISGTLRHPDRQMLKYQIVKEMIDLQAKDLLNASDERLNQSSFKSSADVKKCKKPVIGFSKQMACERNQLQELLNAKLYHHHRVERMTFKAKRIIEDLFNVYKKNPTQLAYSVYERNKKYTPKAEYEIICNYIAGMTDRFALDEHKKLFDPYEKV